ncbi:MAG: hypothetical protein U1F57_11190 [bacterium]
MVLGDRPRQRKILLWLAEKTRRTSMWPSNKNMRFLNLAEKTKEKGLTNLIAVHGDALWPSSPPPPPPPTSSNRGASEAYVLFPDPWPKRRHHKHRLLNVDRTDQLHQFLKKDGRVWVATDHDHYSGQIQAVFPKEKWQFEEGRSLYPTYFETKWKKLGRSIHYFCFVKRN